MSVLSWGKCLLEHVVSEGGEPKGAGSAVWKALPTPKEGTTKVTANAGDVKEAKEEGGGLVDVRYSANTYTLEFDLYVRKGEDRPFEDVDGIVAGEHAFRITPEDEACEGCQIDRSMVRVDESYSTEEGKMLHYVCQCLKPKAGKTVKPYTKGAGG